MRFAKMRLAALLSHDPGVDEPHLSSAQVLHMATQNGARATMFGDRIGTLAAGKRTDAVLLDVDRIATPQLDPRVDIVDALVYRARGLHVDTVIVDGQVLMRDRVLTTIDKASVLNQLADALNQPRSKAEQEWADLAEAITPPRSRLLRRLAARNRRTVLDPQSHRVARGAFASTFTRCPTTHLSASAAPRAGHIR